MKLVIILITVACLQVSARALAQKVTLNEKDAPLEKVFNDIREQTGYNFLYELNILNGTSKVTINVKNASLQEALNQCLANQPLVYTISGNNIGVKKKEIQHAQPQAPLPPVDISGRVTNKAGEALSGATVIIKRTKTGTLTAADGHFLLRDVLQSDTLIISYVGYKQLYVRVGTNTLVNITMEEATNSLDQVVVQAYGKTTDRLNTGDISTVSAKTIENQPVMNPLLALEGQVAGLDVVQQSGYQSAPVKVELRGRSSISSLPSDPLYVIDGVPLSVVELHGTTYPTSSGFSQSGIPGPANGQSPLFSMNPADIASITVLKDAAATAIYGARGANGVILITTKTGSPGQVKLDANVEEGETQITSFLPLLNTQQYIQVREEAFRNDGITPTAGNAYDILQWANNPSTNWEKYLYGGLGHYTNAQTSLSGGDRLTTFRIGVGYTSQVYPTTVNGLDQKAAVSFNIIHKSSNNKFSVSLSGQYTATKSDMTYLSGNVLLPPDAPPIYNAQGGLNYAGWAPISNAYPFGNLLRSYSAETNYVNGKLNLSYEIIKGLILKTDLGYNFAQTDQSDLIPIASQNPANHPTGSTELGYNDNKNWSIEPQLTYDKTISKGKLSVLLGASLQQTNSDGVEIEAEGYTSDYLLKTTADATTTSASNSDGEYKFGSVFGRLSYNWEDKYLLDFTMRRDGSSLFGPDNEYGNFGALGLGYIFTEEKWVKDNVSWLDFGKIRGSYGSTGSDAQIDDYSYLSRYEANSAYIYNGIVPLQPIQHANPNYQWEVNKKLEFGLDLGFLKDRILVSGDYYRNRSGNQLLDYPLPYLTGFNTVIENLGATVQNSGEEFTLKTKIIDHSDFTWTFNFNISINQNKLIAFPNIQNTPFANSGYVVGQPLNLVYKLHYTGVDPLTGQYTFEDKNHDGIISQNPGPTDDRIAYNLNPKFFGGFGTELNYHGIQLTLFFSYKEQIAFDLLSQGSNPGRILGNQSTTILGNEWQYPGQIATEAKFTTVPGSTYSEFGSSDAGLTNASYIKLRNATLSYNLPKELVSKVGITNCRIFFRGENLFVITPFPGIDPEENSLNPLPPYKVFTLGLSVTL